jgi:hypothetical protein
MTKIVASNGEILVDFSFQKLHRERKNGGNVGCVVSKQMDDYEGDFEWWMAWLVRWTMDGTSSIIIV